MADQAECFVSGPLAIALHLSKYLGMAPLRFLKEKNGWRFRISPNLIKFGYFIIMIGSLRCIKIIIQVQQLSKNLKSIVLNGTVILTYVLGGVMVYRAPGRMRCLIVGLNKLSKINSELNIDHWLTPWTKTQILFFGFWAIFNIVINTADFAFVKFFRHGSIQPPHWSVVYTSMALIDSIHFMYHWWLQLATIQFACIVLHVLSTFRNVNQRLRRMLRDNISSSDHRPHESVRIIYCAYATACDVVRDIDSSHGLMLMMLLTIYFLRLFETLYFFTVDLFDAVLVPITFSFVVLQLSWCVYVVVHLVMLIEPCHLTHSEMQTTRLLVSLLKQRASSVYDPLARELDQFCKHINLNDVSYTPLGVTTMSRGLLITASGIISSYLIILVNSKMN